MIRLVVVLLAMGALASCSWFGDSDNLEPPEELESFDKQVRLRSIWSRDTGVGTAEQFVNLVPSVVRDHVQDHVDAAGMSGIQEWLSFYFKSPMCAPFLYPEHDLFVQLAKLKNTLRYLKGEDQITHLGLGIVTDADNDFPIY